MAVSSDDDGHATNSPPLSKDQHHVTTHHGTAVAVNRQKLIRKVDWRLLPILFIVYIAAFLDRVNMSNAITMGLPEELGLKGDQVNVALCIFFIPYILFEIPSNILMKKLKPHVWLSVCTVIFGITTMAQGFVHNYSGILATRFFLGLAESGIFPGSFYLISFWYKKEESQKRFTVYWCSTICAGAFGSLLATGIAHMDGIRNLSNWRWVFILEGIATTVIGVVAYFAVPDFPHEAKWLQEHEREFILNEVSANQSHDTSATAKDVLIFLKSPRNWLGAIMYFSLLVPAYCIAFFTPTIIGTLGYGTVQTQLHSVPPFAAAFGFAVVMAYLSDKFRMRSPFVLLGLALLITGLAILISVHDPSKFSTRYAAVILTAMGSFGVGSHIVCWYVMNLPGHVERSIGSAWMICFGNAGAVVATFAFMDKDAPEYIPGYSACISMAAVCVICCVGYGLLVWRARKSAVGDREENEALYL